MVTMTVVATMSAAIGWFVAGGALVVVSGGLGLFARMVMNDGFRGWGTVLALVAMVLAIVGLCVLALGVPIAQCAPDAYECPV
jgi:hypothetical protein